MKLAQRERRLLTLTLVVVGSVLIYIQLVDPRVARALDLRTQIRAAEADLAETKSLIRNGDEIRSQSDALNLIEIQDEVQGSEETERNRFYSEVERLAQGARMTVIDIRPQRDRMLGSFQLLRLNMLVEGNAEQVARFLHRVGDSTQWMRVDQLSIRALRKPGQLQVEFLVVKVLSAGDRL